jgi:MFS family permease
MSSTLEKPRPAAGSEKSSHPLRVFRNPNFRLYFSGQLISQVGTWMQQVALSWLAYKLTGSPFMLAVVGVSGQLPSLVAMPFAGVFVDRLNRHKILVATSVLAMAEAAILTVLVLSHMIQVWHLVVLGIASGLITAFDMPTRTAFVVELTGDRDDLPTSLAMNAALMNITRLFGPALAGFIVAAAGEGICFLLNAVSYIAVIAALIAIKGDFAPKADKQAKVLDELKSGFKYTFETPPIRALIILQAAFGLGGMAYAMLMPVFVKQIGGNANTLGYLMAASALGSLAGSAALASRKSVLGLGRWVVVASFCFSMALIAFSFTHALIPAMMALSVIGAMMMLQMGSAGTIIQSIVEEDKRGRVMSLFTMAFLGTAPIGSLIAGALADRFGFQHTILGCGIYCLLVAIAFVTQLPRLRRESKPIYIQRGLLNAEEEVDLLTS